MNQNRFIPVFLLVLVLHVLVVNFFNLSAFVSLTLLPLLIFCLPVSCGTVAALLIAFACGFVADFLAGGMIGMSSAALLCVALVRRPLLRLFFGNETFSRQENLSFNRQSPVKILASLSSFIALYLLVFIMLDNAGTRPLWVNAVCFISSLAASVVISMILARVLLSSQENRWR